MMELKDYFRSFSEDELVKGAELFFSGALEDLIRKNGYDAAKNPKADPAPILKRFPEREVTFISAKWRLQELNKKEVSMDCCLRIVPDKKLVCETFCMCEDFHRDHYGCAHVAALLTSYIVDENGENIFKGTRIEERLCSITGTEDPFAPGALKRTDERLLSLLEVNSERALPSFNRDVIRPEPVKVTVRLRCEGGRKYIGLKAGLSKRMYLVQSLGTFLDAYRNEHLYFFGKKEARLGRVYMEEHSARIAGFLADIYSASEKGLLRGNIFASEGGHSDKYMLLTGSEFDSFMELLDGMKLEDANDEMEYPVCLDKKGLKARVRKKAYGAALKVEDSELLCINGDNLYLKDDECIFRVRTQNARKRQELLSMLNWTDELYIRDSELAAVCRNLLPVFEEYGELTVTGMELSDYRSEIPDFVFKLDYTDEGLLTCDPIAVYGKQDFQCPLFDSKAEAGKRDPEAEGAAAVTLQNIFSHLDKNGHMLYSELSEEELFDFMKDYLPVLEKLGKVMATERLKRNRIRRLPKVAVGVSVEKGDMLISLKGTGLSQFEMADILGAYRKRKRYYRLRSGEFISMEGEGDETWGTISELFGEYGKKDPESFKVPLFRALYLNEMLENRDNVDFAESGEFRQLILNMDRDKGKDVKTPDSLKKILRPYQNAGFKWISMLKECGFGGILADDMGLGKTLQVLAFILSEKEKQKSGDELRTLVVCPASLVYNWQKEIEKYTPTLTSIVIAGTAEQRRDLILGSEDRDIWITSYDLLKRDIAMYEDITFANEIIDEAQFVKNQRTQAAQSVRVIKSSFRMALTGTPIENYLSELWSIMDYLMPGVLYSYGKFQHEYETPVVSLKDEEVLIRLRRMVHPFILRRLKKEILKELPDKLEEVVTVRMETEQRRLYDASVEEIKQMLESTGAEEFNSGKLEYLAKLTGLRQICCDPSLLYEDYRGGSAKLEACMELIVQAISGGHKLLLFSQFTSMLDIIGSRLKEEDIEYHRIDGSVSKEKRMEMVDSFAGDNVPVFLISLKAGGTGLNLTAADIVIHYDPWWNQAAQNQATDRTHRIGQTKKVTVYELIAQNTVEEKIQSIKEAKHKLVEDVLSGDTISRTSINREELLELLRQE